jgi:hypothetical protein
MATAFRSRLARLAPPMLAGVVPTLALAIGNAQFILNHFFIGAPYLLDSGFYSALVYHAGVSPQNPNIALDFESRYFSFHFSPFVSLFSLLSYLQPLGRIEWYAVFQAIVFAPIGIATYALARHVEPDGMLRRLPITMFAALAFSFSGLVLTFVGYPHYEPAIPGLVCLVLVFVVTGRIRLAWVFLVLAASVREDAGFHTAFALMPLLYLRWRGVDTAATRRQLMVMIAAAFTMSVAAVAVLKVFFASTTLSNIYLGSPPFGHVTTSLIVDRARIFATNCQHIYYPFLATCLVVVLRRDLRYLLGWAATTPWFLLNLLAVQQVKASFFAYAGITFLVAIFWVYVYGARLAPAARRLRPGVIEAVFALVSVSSTLGVYRENEVAARIIATEMVMHRRWPRAQVHRFAETIGEHKDVFGRLYVDYAVASLTLEWLRSSNSWHPGTTWADAIAFHRELYVTDPVMLNDLVASRLDVCTRPIGTKLMVCTHDRLPADMFAGIDTQVIPAVFAFTQLYRRGITVDSKGIVLRNQVSVYGRLGQLPAGTYDLTVQLDAEAASPPGTLAEIAVQAEAVDYPVVRTPTGSRELACRFTVDARRTVTFRVSPWLDAPLTITGARIRRVEPP